MIWALVLLVWCLSAVTTAVLAQIDGEEYLKNFCNPIMPNGEREPRNGVFQPPNLDCPTYAIICHSNGMGFLEYCKTGEVFVNGRCSPSTRQCGGNDEIDCRKYPGRQMLPNGCNREYYWCTDGRLTKHNCTRANTYFNPANLQCDFFENVELCMGTTQAKDAVTTVAYKSKHTTERYPIDCVGYEDGDYADPTLRCSNRYYTCANQVPFRRNCPENLFFDVEFMGCEIRSRVLACNGSRPTIASPPSFQCPEPNGNFADPSAGECATSYFVCSNGKATPATCQDARQAFNPNIKICDAKAGVTGCDPGYCKTKSNGRYALPGTSECDTKYLECVFGRSYVRACALPLVYNKASTNCEYRHDVVACGVPNLDTSIPEPEPGLPPNAAPTPSVSTVTSNPTYPSKSRTRTPPTETVPDLCKGKLDGTYPNPGSNKCAINYLLCAAGKAFIRPCPRGLIFDALSIQCVWPESVPGCSQITSPPPGAPEPTVTYPSVPVPTSTSETQPSNYGNNIAPPARSDRPTFKRSIDHWGNSCLGKEDGFYYVSKCSRMFVACYNGKDKMYKCPDDYVYNSNEGRCIVPQLLSECDTTTSGGIDGSYCNDKVDGSFPYQPCSVVYIVCRNKKTVIIDCKLGEVFNPTNGRCDQPNRVAECLSTDNDDIPVPTPQPPVENSPLCPADVIGLFPVGVCEPEHYSCFNGQLLHHYCPDGRVFHASSSRCVRPAECNQQRTEDDSGVDSYGRTDKNDANDRYNVDVNGGKTTPPTDSNQLCPRNVVGLFPLGTCVPEHYSCFNGQLLHHYCPDGTVFHSASAQCVNPDQCWRPSDETNVDNGGANVDANTYQPPRQPDVPPTHFVPTVPPTPGFVCPESRDGLYFASICSSEFNLCINGKASKMTCQNGDVYDSKSRYCAPRPASCGGNVGLSNDGSIADTLSNGDQDFCTNKRDGVYKRGDCLRDFNYCFNNRLTINRCNPGFVFDETNGGCVSDNFCFRASNGDSVDIDSINAKNEENSFVCSTKRDGLYASGKCSRLFWYCFNSKSIPMYCKEDDVFELASGFCKSKATCEPQSENDIIFVDNHLCRNIPDGYYQRKPCAAEYYQCFDDSLIVKLCFSGYVFDETIGQCVPRTLCARSSVASALPSELPNFFAPTYDLVPFSPDVLSAASCDQYENFVECANVCEFTCPRRYERDCQIQKPCKPACNCKRGYIRRLSDGLCIKDRECYGGGPGFISKEYDNDDWPDFFGGDFGDDWNSRDSSGSHSRERRHHKKSVGDDANKFFCSGRANGHYAMYGSQGCSNLYYKCRHNKAEFWRCSKNKIFDIKKKRCVKKKSSRSCWNDINTLDSFFCQGKYESKNYSFPFPDCSKQYYNCTGGKPYVKTCESGYVFSDRENRCVKSRKCRRQNRRDTDPDFWFCADKIEHGFSFPKQTCSSRYYQCHRKLASFRACKKDHVFDGFSCVPKQYCTDTDAKGDSLDESGSSTSEVSFLLKEDRCKELDHMTFIVTGTKCVSDFAVCYNNRTTLHHCGGQSVLTYEETDTETHTTFECKTLTACSKSKDKSSSLENNNYPENDDFCEFHSVGFYAEKSCGQKYAVCHCTNNNHTVDGTDCDPKLLRLSCANRQYVFDNETKECVLKRKLKRCKKDFDAKEYCHGRKRGKYELMPCYSDYVDCDNFAVSHCESGHLFSEMHGCAPMEHCHRSNTVFSEDLFYPGPDGPSDDDIPYPYSNPNSDYQGRGYPDSNSEYQGRGYPEGQGRGDGSSDFRSKLRSLNYPPSDVYDETRMSPWHPDDFDDRDESRNDRRPNYRNEDRSPSTSYYAPFSNNENDQLIIPPNYPSFDNNENPMPVYQTPGNQQQSGGYDRSPQGSIPSSNSYSPPQYPQQQNSRSPVPKPINQNRFVASGSVSDKRLPIKGPSVAGPSNNQGYGSNQPSTYQRPQSSMSGSQPQRSNQGYGTSQPSTYQRPQNPISGSQPQFNKQGYGANQPSTYQRPQGSVGGSQPKPLPSVIKYPNKRPTLEQQPVPFRRESSTGGQRQSGGSLPRPVPSKQNVAPYVAPDRTYVTPAMTNIFHTYYSPKPKHGSFVPNSGGVGSSSSRQIAGPPVAQHLTTETPQSGYGQSVPGNSDNLDRYETNGLPPIGNVGGLSGKETGAATGEIVDGRKPIDENREFETFCSKKPDGHYRHPLDCYQYLQCANKITYPMKCAQGLVFNPNKSVNTCDWPTNVPECNFLPFSFNVAGEIQDPECDGKPNGAFLRVPSDCKRFQRCVYGRLYNFDCPADSVFNEQLNVCDWPDNVPECSGKDALLTYQR